VSATVDSTYSFVMTITEDRTSNYRERDHEVAASGCPSFTVA